MEHKARSILDPALYSERYIKQRPDPAAERSEKGRVRRHHSSSSCCGSKPKTYILTKCSAPASIHLAAVSGWQRMGGHGAGGSWCRYMHAASKVKRLEHLFDSVMHALAI